MALFILLMCAIPDQVEGHDYSPVEDGRNGFARTQFGWPFGALYVMDEPYEGDGSDSVLWVDGFALALNIFAWMALIGLASAPYLGARIEAKEQREKVEQ